MWYLSQRSLQAPYSLRDLHIYYVYCLNILNRHSSFGAYVYVYEVMLIMFKKIFVLIEFLINEVIPNRTRCSISLVNTLMI